MHLYEGFLLDNFILEFDFDKIFDGEKLRSRFHCTYAGFIIYEAFTVQERLRHSRTKLFNRKKGKGVTD